MSLCVLRVHRRHGPPAACCAGRCRCGSGCGVRQGNVADPAQACLHRLPAVGLPVRPGSTHDLTAACELVLPALCSRWTLRRVCHRPARSGRRAATTPGLSEVTAFPATGSSTGTASRPVAPGLSGRSGWLLASDLLVDLRPPRLVLMREPHQLRVESADQSLAFGARLVELPEEDGCVAGNDDRAAARLDDDHL
jgi:hypothetical protein